MRVWDKMSKWLPLWLNIVINEVSWFLPLLVVFKYLEFSRGFGKIILYKRSGFYTVLNMFNQYSLPALYLRIYPPSLGKLTVAAWSIKSAVWFKRFLHFLDEYLPIFLALVIGIRNWLNLDIMTWEIRISVSWTKIKPNYQFVFL